MIVADFVVSCDSCHDSTVVEIDSLRPGERITVPLPNGWNGVDTGRVLCSRCSSEPVPRPDTSFDMDYPDPPL